MDSGLRRNDIGDGEGLVGPGCPDIRAVAPSLSSLTMSPRRRPGFRLRDRGGRRTFRMDSGLRRADIGDGESEAT